MANLNDLSNFLKPADITNGEVVTFIDAGEIKMVRFGQQPEKKVFQISVELANGKQKIVTLNSTSRQILGGFWGTDTENWVGKKALITKTKQNVAGQIKEVMTFQPSEEEKTPF